MKLKRGGGVLLLLVVVVILQINCAQELNLNFQQNDYDLKFERGEIVRFNKDYIKEVNLKTFKYNRTIAVMNSSVIPKIDLGTEMLGIIQVYKFMSNEYRFFPIHFAANVCKAIAANVGGLKTAILRCGNISGCLFRKGIRYYTCNAYPDQSKLPPNIPNGQYKVEIQLLHSSQEFLVVNVYVTVSRPIL